MKDCIEEENILGEHTDWGADKKQHERTQLKLNNIVALTALVICNTAFTNEIANDIAKEIASAKR